MKGEAIEKQLELLALLITQLESVGHKTPMEPAYDLSMGDWGGVHFLSLWFCCFFLDCSSPLLSGSFQMVIGVYFLHLISWTHPSLFSMRLESRRTGAMPNTSLVSLQRREAII